MVALRASASRARDVVRDARQDLAAVDDAASEDDRSRVRKLASALTELESLAGALAAPRISPSRLELAGERVRQALADTTAALPTIDVTPLVTALRRGGGHAPTQAGVSKPVGPPGGSSDTPQSVSYQDYSGPAFQAKLPTGGGWAAPAQSEPTPGRLYRTSVRGPNGLFAIIDYTPLEAAQFGGRYESRTQVGHTAFGSATRYVFQGGRLPECQRARCVDYIINDPSGGGGFGVLAGGGDFATASAVAQTVAESVTPVGE